MWIWLVNGHNLWIKECIFLCITFFNCYNLENPMFIHAHFFPLKHLNPMFQDYMVKSHYNLTTCPWNRHNQHWVKCIMNNPFVGLGSLGLAVLHFDFDSRWFAWTKRQNVCKGELIHLSIDMCNQVVFETRLPLYPWKLLWVGIVTQFTIYLFIPLCINHIRIIIIYVFCCCRGKHSK